MYPSSSSYLPSYASSGSICRRTSTAPTPSAPEIRLAPPSSTPKQHSELSLTGTKLCNKSNLSLAIPSIPSPTMTLPPGPSETSGALSIDLRTINRLSSQFAHPSVRRFRRSPRGHTEEVRVREGTAEKGRGKGCEIGGVQIRRGHKEDTKSTSQRLSTPMWEWSHKFVYMQSTVMASRRSAEAWDVSVAGRRPDQQNMGKTGTLAVERGLTSASTARPPNFE